MTREDTVMLYQNDMAMIEIQEKAVVPYSTWMLMTGYGMLFPQIPDYPTGH